MNKIRQSTKHQLRKHADGVAHALAAYFGRAQFNHVLEITLEAVAVWTVLLHVVGWFSVGLDRRNLDRRKWHLHGRAWEVRSVAVWGGGCVVIWKMEPCVHPSIIPSASTIFN